MNVKTKVHTIIVESLENVLMRFAKPLVPENDTNPNLVIAPHPDDETLGCGATILRLRKAGRRVRIVTVTDGRASEQTPQLTPEELAALREREMIKACARLGVPAEDVVFLRYKDREAAQNINNITRDLRREIENLAPRQIFGPSSLDKNDDHKATARALADAAGQAKTASTIYGYIIWFSLTGYFFRILPLLVAGRFRRVKVNGYAEKKLNAFKAHVSQYNAENDPEKDFWKRFFRPYEIFVE